jgi:8-oxo-dGTP pyrophosphatase MutT (NUDIX family)
MVLFFDDRPVTIIRSNELSHRDSSYFDAIVDLRLTKLKTIHLDGHVLLLNTTTSLILQIVQQLQNEPPKELLSITLSTDDKTAVEDKIKGMFKVIKAAGGIVTKQGEYLLIYRRKKWDLPKGKLDKGEESRHAAVREIEEETGVKAIIQNKICTTWHTYTENNSKILKRTKWYLLESVDDSKMQPQTEEEIEKLEWINPKKAQILLVNSFSSIRYVVDRLQKMQEVIQRLK